MRVLTIFILVSVCTALEAQSQQPAQRFPGRQPVTRQPRTTQFPPKQEPNPNPGEPRTTELKVKILVGKAGIGLAAQQWQQVFARMQIPVQIRRPVLQEKLEIKEDRIGTIRIVTAVGEIDRTGQLVFPTKRFSRNDGAKLKEYFDELKTYGAQGAPEGKPLWGLSQPQFTAVYNAMTAKLEKEVKEKTLDEALKQFDLPEEYPIRVSAVAREWLLKEFSGKTIVRQELKSFSKGTALAILLNDYGLGIRPQRTPSGSLELAIDPLRVTSTVWPIGWDLKLSRQKTAPKLFELVPVELDDVKFLDVLYAISVRTKIPVRLDYYRLEGNGIDITNLRVSHKPKQTSWSLVLRGITNPYKMTRKIIIDEQGQPFIWITLLQPGKPND